MNSWAAPGVKCVCVRTAPAEVRVPGGVYPVVGHIYTVRDIVFLTVGKDAGRPSLLVSEIRNDPAVCKHLGYITTREPAFPIDAFEPLVTRTIEQDLAIFTPLLDTVEEDA